MVLHCPPPYYVTQFGSSPYYVTQYYVTQLEGRAPPPYQMPYPKQQNSYNA